jgi:hypothetical protein
MSLEAAEGDTWRLPSQPVHAQFCPPPCEAGTTLQYKVIDLGRVDVIPPEAADSTFGLNADGVAVYHYRFTDGGIDVRHGAFWAPDNRYGAETCGVRQDLNTRSGLSPATYTLAADVSDFGIVGGTAGSGVPTGAAHHWTLSAATPLSHGSLGVLPGGTHSLGFAINDHPVNPTIVGECRLGVPCSAGSSAPVRFILPNGPMELLAPVGNQHLESLAFDVNNEALPRAVGQLLLFGGSCFMSEPFPCSSDQDAAQWVGTQLGASLVPLDAVMEFEARGVNNAGMSVGYGYNPNANPPPQCLRRALRWSATGVRFDDLWGLPQLSGQDTQAEAITNETGGILRVVGRSFTLNHALLWEQIGSTWEVFDLNDLICRSCGLTWVLRAAEDINDSGWVVGWGSKDSQIHGFLLIPMEECGDFTCLGDVNGDGNVNVYDLLAVLGTWGCCVSGDICLADQDCNGTVNVSDLNIVISAWGILCGGEAMMAGESASDAAALSPPTLAEIIEMLLEMGYGEEASQLLEIVWGP